MFAKQLRTFIEAGVLHSFDKNPAVTTYYQGGFMKTAEYYRLGVLHNSHGPAYIEKANKLTERSLVEKYYHQIFFQISSEQIIILLTFD